ncbi:phosphotransferase family protein [Litoreibacter sp.]|nr:phosphotransferase family protein [Litoreibacter sp.]
MGAVSLVNRALSRKGMAMGPQADITVDILRPYLRQEVPWLGGLQDIQKFATGQSNPTYKLTSTTGAYVLRAKPAGTLLKSAHMVEREFRVMAALHESGVPVPRMIHLASDETSPIGRAFFIMEMVEGRIFWDPAVPEVSKTERAAIYDQMNVALVALHNVDVGAAGLSDFGKPGSYFERQTDKWSRQYVASKTVENADMDRLMDWLKAHLPPDDGQIALVHGDYRLDNMIFASDAPRVVAVLDWELSTLGHPLADLAYQCMQWRLPNRGGMRGLGGLDRTAMGIPTEREYVSTYCARRGIEPPDNWAFYLAFSFFRLAAILEGVVRRAHDGNASNPETARSYAAAIPLLAVAANDIINGTST